MSADRWVDIEVEEVLKLTDLAALCVIDDEEVWIPLSQIDGIVEEGEQADLVCVTRWFAEKEGLL
jgi:hypothetical protein